MSTAVLSNVTKDPSNAPVPGVVVRCRLRPGPGWRADQSEVATEVDLTSDPVTGAWSVLLERNTDITPAGTWYEIVEEIPATAGGTRSYAVSVAGAGGSVQASLVTPSASTGLLAYLTQTAGDARYQVIGALGGGGEGPVLGTGVPADGVSAIVPHIDHGHTFENTAWSTYVPVWSASGTQPAIGNGTITGRFKRIGKTLHWRVEIVMGSTTTYGTGIWGVSLPAGLNAVNTGQSHLVPAFANGTAAFAGMVLFSPNGTVGLIYFANSGATSNLVNCDATHPFTWASTHVLTIEGILELA